MFKSGVEFFIAKRLSGKGGVERKNVMVRIATYTVAVSIAVMILSIAVIIGFKRELTDKLVGFDAHVNVVSIDGRNSLETPPILRDSTLENSLRSVATLDKMSVYAMKGGIMRSEQAIQGVLLKGVDSDYEWKFFKESLVEGELPRVGDSIKRRDIMISSSLSRTLNLGVGQVVEVLLLKRDETPRRDRFKISGIYNTGFNELDMMVVFTDIRDVQRLNNWSDDQISGYEIRTSRFDDLATFRSDIYALLLDYNQSLNVTRNNNDTLTAVTIEERYPAIFDWLKAHNVNAVVIIVIMLLVTFLNMVSALLIIVLERTKMIGVLKALGMTNGAIQRIFLIRSSYIVLKGLLIGNILGIGLCLLQKYSGLIKLSQEGYLLSVVPVQLNISWIVWINVGTFVVILALLAIPTMIVSRIRPDSTIRYQ